MSLTADCWNLPDRLYIWREGLTGCLDIHSSADVEWEIPCLVTRQTLREIELTIPQIVGAVKIFQRPAAVSGNNVPIATPGVIQNIRFVGTWSLINVKVSNA